MRVLDLFSGIGGFSIGLERAGMETVAFCEIEEYPRKVLKKHWPNIPIYEDVKYVTKKRLDADGIGRIDVVTGGFPCQDISVAGSQAGIEGARSGLWRELCRIISDFRPKYAIVENVTALISGDNGRWFGKVLGDLAKIGYDCEWHCISASELGAHHHRDRVWIIVYPQELQCNGSDDNGKDSKCEISKSGNSDSKKYVANSNKPQLKRRSFSERIQAQYDHVISTSGWKVEPRMDRVAYGVPDFAHRLKGLGNAVVPQIPELIGRAIMEVTVK